MVLKAHMESVECPMQESSQCPDPPWMRPGERLLWYSHVTCRSCDLKVVSLVVMQLVTLTLVVTWYRYGFDYGSVHFVLMSTEHNFTQGSPQYKFLENHLASVNRTLTPWLIFGGHRYVVCAQCLVSFPDHLMCCSVNNLMLYSYVWGQ